MSPAPRRRQQVLEALLKGELASGEIARRTGMRKRYASQLLVRLCREGLIVRAQHGPDFRFVYYRLTKAGWRLTGGGYATAARDHQS